MKPSFLGPNIFFSYFEIMAQFNDHNLFQIEQNLNKINQIKENLNSNQKSSYP